MKLEQLTMIKINLHKVNVDYADMEDGESVNEQSVPFSCCNRRAMMPCIHVGMRGSDERTVNGRGCADIISRILFKITVVGYTMTGLIIGTQILMIIFFVRVCYITVDDHF